MSFRKFSSSLSLSSSTSINEDNHTTSSNNIKSVQSHRSFLRQKDSSSSISSSPSSSTLNNHNNNNNNNNNSPNRNYNNNNNNNSSYSNYSNSSSSANMNHNSTSMNSTNSTGKSQHHSLRRFFKKFKHRESPPATGSSTPSNNHSRALSAGRQGASNVNIFAKYGVPGKLLGTGASGSVNIITSESNPNEVYAVKKFRARLNNENELDYKNKVAHEYRISEYLNHENIIRTFELIRDSRHENVTDYYIVMEYCKYDFFNLVMSGLMETNEIYCYTKQIIRGVDYLHSNGLAHRDLKLDNCVVNSFGVLKIIDFGSSVHFRKEIPNGYYITENDIMLGPNTKLIPARGVVGSDPYLSPEVFEPQGLGYDPRGADVWSIAIIYCCMILKRFPWKLPKLSDPSYKSFAGPQLDGYNSLEYEGEDDLRHSHHPPVGPERLLRLLPVESRNVIKHMLILDPRKRYSMYDVMSDEFVQSIQNCTSGHSSSNHTHHLVTEDELNKINQERDKLKRLKDAGVA
ncbi:LOW QUALITY PROTEIN: RTK1 Probable serine/threonine-protein kinase RTK1 [Candida maltosa Xu316]